MSSMNPNALLLWIQVLVFLITLPFKIYSWVLNSLRNRIKRKQNEGRSAWKFFLPGSIIAIPVFILLIIGIFLVSVQEGQVGGPIIILSLLLWPFSSSFLSAGFDQRRKVTEEGYTPVQEAELNSKPETEEEENWWGDGN
ncbi:MAG: hypothetical protein ACPHKZ_02445 [Candidatus Thalassarchaeaceae archaeon]